MRPTDLNDVPSQRSRNREVAEHWLSQPMGCYSAVACAYALDADGATARGLAVEMRRAWPWCGLSLADATQSIRDAVAEGKEVLAEVVRDADRNPPGPGVDPDALVPIQGVHDS